MKLKIPAALIIMRLFLGLVIVVLSLTSIPHYKTIAVTLLSIGLLSDVFDGIVARRLQISTQRLRRLDSTVDQVFFIAVAAATFIRCPWFFREHALMLSVLVGVEVLSYLISFLRFRKEIATHSIGAKIWTLFLFATLVQVIVQCASTLIFQICFWLGLATRFEIIAIIFTLKDWTNDVPSLFHAVKLRKGQPIKRNKMFNG